MALPTSRILTCLVLAAAAGCASGGGDTPVGAARDRVTTAQGRTGHNDDIRSVSDEQVVDGLILSAPADVWPRLPIAFEELGIEVTYSDPARFAMGNRGFRVRRIDGKRPAEFLDCGYGNTAQPYANLYEVTMGIVVQLVEGEDGGTRAQVRVDGAAKPRGVSGHAVSCTTKRTLERRLLTLIG